MKYLVILIIGFLTGIYPVQSWAGPSQYELDYSFAKPLTIETRIFNGLGFNIIKQKILSLLLSGSHWMAELWADNYLIIDVRSDSSNSGSVLVAERNEGEFSFEAGPPPLIWSTLIVSKGGLSYGYQTTQTRRDRHQVTPS